MVSGNKIGTMDVLKIFIVILNSYLQRASAALDPMPLFSSSLGLFDDSPLYTPIRFRLLRATSSAESRCAKSVLNCFGIIVTSCLPPSSSKVSKTNNANDE